MASGRIRLTRGGYEKLKTELEGYLAKSHLIAKDIDKARQLGDLKENAEYDAAKNAQAMNESKIADIQNSLSRAEILDETGMDKDKILLGATATLRDLDTGQEEHYTLVEAAEADYNEGKISLISPIGKAILGHKVGDEIGIKVPAGTLRYEVIKIER